MMRAMTSDQFDECHGSVDSHRPHPHLIIPHSAFPFPHRVFLAPAGPNLQVGEPAGQHFGQRLDGETLAGEVAGQQQANAQRFGLEARVESGLAHHHRVATVLPGGVEQFARRAARHRHGANGLIRLADELQPLDRKEPLEPLGKLPERKRIGEPSPSARALAFRVRHQRRDAAQLKAGGQSLIDSLAGRVERRMGLNTATRAAIKSSSIRPTVVSAVSRFVAANGIG